MPRRSKRPPSTHTILVVDDQEDSDAPTHGGTAQGRPTVQA